LKAACLPREQQPTLGLARRAYRSGLLQREELKRLRKENSLLQMERDILKKATAFFASENK